MNNWCLLSRYNNPNLCSSVNHTCCTTPTSWEICTFPMYYIILTVKNQIRICMHMTQAYQSLQGQQLLTWHTDTIIQVLIHLIHAQIMSHSYATCLSTISLCAHVPTTNYYQVPVIAGDEWAKLHIRGIPPLGRCYNSFCVINDFTECK